MKNIAFVEDKKDIEILIKNNIIPKIDVFYLVKSALKEGLKCLNGQHICLDEVLTPSEKEDCQDIAYCLLQDFVSKASKKDTILKIVDRGVFFPDFLFTITHLTAIDKILKNKEKQTIYLSKNTSYIQKSIHKKCQEIGLKNIIVTKKGFENKFEFSILADIKSIIVVLKHSIITFLNGNYYITKQSKAVNFDKKISFYITKEENLKTLIPIWTELKKNNVEICGIFQNKVCYNLNKIEGKLRVINQVQNLNFQLPQYFLNAFNEVNKKKSLKNINDQENNFQYLGYDTSKLLKDLFSRQIKKYFFRINLNTYVFTDHLIEYKPNLLVLSNDTWWNGKLAVTLARKYGVKTLTIQHGVIGDIYGYLPSADKFACWGETDKKRLMSKNIDESRIVVTGSPKLDGIKQQKKIIEIKKVYGFPNNKKIILLALGELDKDYQYIAFKTVIEKIEQLEDVILLVKLHPGDNSNVKHQYQKRGKIQFYSENLYDLLSISDLVISRGSTVILEASKFKIPVILINIGNRTPIPFAEEGLAEAIYHKKEFIPLTTNLLYNLEFRKKILAKQSNAFLKFNYGNNGKSAERITRLILSILE